MTEPPLVLESSASEPQTDPVATKRKFTLHWVLWLRVSNQRAGNKVLGWFSEALGREVTVTVNERYWKDPSLRRVMATSPVHAQEIAEAVFEVLRVCGHVAYGWNVSGPIWSTDGWNFQGDAGWRPNARIKVVGLDCVEFELSEYGLPTGPEANTLDTPSS